MVTALVHELKEAGQDREFYPTTDEIIRAMLKDCEHLRDKYDDRIRCDSVLDIGAGNGKVLDAFENYAKYAIEKSLKLCSILSKKAFVIGTEFREQSLLDKQVDLTFCNPPYSEFEEWAVKIIRESASKVVYLVIPTRWEASTRIADALKYREAKHKVLGTFSFEDSEDRQARATVHLIRIQLSTETDDAFDRFFKEQFAGLHARFKGLDPVLKPEDETEYEFKNKQGAKFADIVGAKNFPEALVHMYEEEIAHIQRNYAAVAELDPELLREFEVYPEKILECLKARLIGLKNKYWSHLFTNMNEITNRLTSRKRRELLNQLNANAHVDFTLTNIYAVVIWTIQNANSYIDAQLLEVFDTMLEKANVKNYKSNQRQFLDNEWRYGQKKPTHVYLEYRIVLVRAGGIIRKTEYSFDTGLEERAALFIQDMLTVAYNLGFKCDTTDFQLHQRKDWADNGKREFYFQRDGGGEVLFEVRAFFNGNMHIRLNQDFALALNVEVGRLRGWIFSGKEAAEEMDNPKAAQYFNTQHVLCPGSMPKLLPAA